MGSHWLGKRKPQVRLSANLAAPSVRNINANTCLTPSKPVNIEISRRSPALASLLSLSVGIAGDHFFAPHFVFWLVAVVLLTLPLLLSGWVIFSPLARLFSLQRMAPPERNGQNSATVNGLMLLLLITVTGGCWHHGFWNFYREDHLAFSLSRRPQAVMLTLSISGPIQYLSAREDENPERGEQKLRVRFLAEVVKVRRGTSWVSQTGRCRVTILGRPAQPLRRGDVVVAYAMAQLVSPAQNPGQNDFAYYERLHRRLFSLTVFSPEHARVEFRQGRWHYARIIDRYRRYFSETLEIYVGTPHDSLAQALLLGQRERISNEHRDRYVQAGVIHLLAISGLHVGILASGVWILQRMGWLPRRLGLLVMAVLIIAYTLLTGANPPVVRAAILVLSLCLGQHDGRVTRGIDSLALGGVLLLIWNPCHLFMLGVQLSFLAVATLMVLARTSVEPADPLTRLIANTRPWFVKAARAAVRSAAELLWLGSTVWLVTTPLVVASFQIASPVALVLNPLLTIPIALALFSSLLTLVFAPVVPYLASVTGWLCSTTLHCVESLVDLGLTVPAGRLHCASPSPLWILTATSRRRQRGGAVVMAVWLASGLALAHYRVPAPNTLTCTVLSVGHGTCVVLELPNGETCIYDAGCLGDANYGSRVIATVLRHSRIHFVDTMILSHADSDHYNAAPKLLRNFPVGKVAISASMFARISPPLRELLNAIEESGARQQIVATGERLAESQEFSIDVLHPPPDRSFHSDNANSVVVSVRFQGIRILLPGDLEADGMQHLLATPSKHHDIALAPHHGSLRSRPGRFSSWCQPQTVVISGRDGTSLDESLAAFRELGTQPISTTQGAVQITIRDGTAEVRQWRNGQWCDEQSPES
jgi:competence protein ComEC